MWFDFVVCFCGLPHWTNSPGHSSKGRNWCKSQKSYMYKIISLHVYVHVRSYLTACCVEQGGHSGKSSCLPPSGPGLNSGWGIISSSCLFVLARLLQGFFSEFASFPSSTKTNKSKFQFDLETVDEESHPGLYPYKFLCLDNLLDRYLFIEFYLLVHVCTDTQYMQYTCMKSCLTFLFCWFLYIYSYATQIHCLLSKRWDVICKLNVHVSWVTFLTPAIITFINTKCTNIVSNIYCPFFPARFEHKECSSISCFARHQREIISCKCFWYSRSVHWQCLLLTESFAKKKCGLGEF